jgi:hypothetical protein
MRNFSTWLLVMFMVMFWIFRAVVAFCTEMSIDCAGLTVLNMNIEIALLFITLLCLILIVKRSLIGGLIYLLSYGMYYGVYIFNNVKILMENSISIDVLTNLFISVIGMIIPIAVLIDLLADKNRKAHPVDKKTDWFYKNENYDRKLDDRADKNNYRTL